MTKNCLKNLKIILHFYLAVFCIFSCQGDAGDKGYFVYLKSNESNLRAGPSKKYQIKWVIQNKGEPLKVVTKFEQWIKVKDIDGDEGWLMDSLVTRNIKGGIIIGNKLLVMYRRPDLTSKKLVRLQPRVRVKVHKCTDYGWCNISAKDFKGWILKKHLWGV